MNFEKLFKTALESYDVKTVGETTGGYTSKLSQAEFTRVLHQIMYSIEVDKLYTKCSKKLLLFQVNPTTSFYVPSKHKELENGLIVNESRVMVNHLVAKADTPLAINLYTLYLFKDLITAIDWQLRSCFRLLNAKNSISKPTLESLIKKHEANLEYHSKSKPNLEPDLVEEYIFPSPAVTLNYDRIYINGTTAVTPHVTFTTTTNTDDTPAF